MEINCDLGEGLENDAQLMPYLDSCNIACGGHAGNPDSIRKTVRLAKIFQVKVGAHPSYPDLVNFGRRVMDISPAVLKNQLIDQIQQIQYICEEEKYPLTHVKPHGALYNELAKNHELAMIFCDLLQENFPGKILYSPPNSIIENQARKRKIPLMLEIFADRNYNEDYSLVNRMHANALITDQEEALAHVRLMLEEKKIKTLSGLYIAIHADTICIHGDNPGALNILKIIRKNLNF
ncbi:5-oxoprolinase subunit PxpA [Cecembia sp.]|uniref:5-oxoprolinase subunit PxpA n=1 Tax=Cecembia sp. TaxID=1898110 RepID=UPI0025B9DAA0|nr:5-oxoprolinase subunit PxpA [Cecembia sp.]